ncbi:hypothetical protein, partial [Actinomadura sp. 7K507]|uniref:hypothetical protein n=1 Tax=Actinomadura sp. 7K507 TaxID=2530365 RepID=UPI00104AC83E
MGHRANYIIVDRGQHQIHFSRFGALSLASDPLMGPEDLEPYIRSMERRDELTNDVWCEGSLVLDLDTWTLLFWTDHCPARVNLELRTALLRLLGERWPEWNVSWAVNQHADVVAHLGLDPEGLIEGPKPPKKLTVEQIMATVNQGRPGSSLQEQRRRITGTDPNPYYLEAETILTVRFPDGEVRNFSTLWGIDRVMTAGEDLLAALQSAPGTTLPRLEHVQGGALIDVAARTVKAWPLPDPGTEPWHGWQVTWSDFGLARQAAETGRDPSAVAQTPAHLLRETANLVGAADEVQRMYRALADHLAGLRAAGAE